MSSLRNISNSLISVWSGWMLRSFKIDCITSRICLSSSGTDFIFLWNGLRRPMPCPVIGSFIFDTLDKSRSRISSNCSVVMIKILRFDVAKVVKKYIPASVFHDEIKRFDTLLLAGIFQKKVKICLQLKISSINN